MPEVWLPGALNARDDILALPVKTLPGWQRGVRFTPLHPGYPEVVQIDAAAPSMEAAACPNVFNTEENSPSACVKAGDIDGRRVYVIRRLDVSNNLHAYMERGETLIAVTGVHSKAEAITYLRSFVKVARRDVDARLATNRQLADKAAAAIRKEKKAEEVARATAYKRIPYDPALPAILPAGWIRHSMRIGGKDPVSPTEVEVRYKKGRERFITLTILPKTSVTLGTACGPAPGTGGAPVPCSQVPGEDYYVGGVNEPDRIALYMFRPVGDVVAVVQTSVHSDNGQPLLFSDYILETQKSIVKSLRQTDKSRLEGALFAGAYYDPYPNVKP